MTAMIGTLANAIVIVIYEYIKSTHVHLKCTQLTYTVSIISPKKKKVLSALATQMQKAENGIIDSTGAPK